MLKQSKKKNQSPMKKMLPAVCMLTLSAVMLSSATYAWFTMNTEVEVTGLSMAATVSDGLEISLGAFGAVGEDKTISTNAPADDDQSWRRAFRFADYYETVGKLKPASSNDALKIFYVDTQGVFAGGRDVEKGTEVTQATTGAAFNLDVEDNDNDLITIANGTAKPNGATDNYDANDEKTSAGYYIDIPMWIRTNNHGKTSGTTIYCKVTIDDNVSPGIGGVNDGTDLKKAVRVAIIPIDNSNSGGIIDNAVSATYTAKETQTIFGLTNDLYKDKAIMQASTKADGGYRDTIMGTQTVVTDSATNAATVFIIPEADNEKYGEYAFMVRVWLEGESKFCNDATANQDWNIDLHFSTEAST